VSLLLARLARLARLTRLALVPLASLTSLVGCGSLPTAVRTETAKTAKTAPGKVTVVRFVDFECPFCRKAHAAMKQGFGPDRARARVVNKHVPLSIHKHALVAAKGSICAERLGTPEQADAVDDKLYETDLSEADATSIAALVSNAGLPVADVVACMDSRETVQRLEYDGRAFDDAGGEGVPLVYVGSIKIDGAQPPEVYQAALRASLER